MEEHPRAVDVSELEGAGFVDAEPRAVAGEEQGPVLRGGDRAEHLPDLLDAEHGGKGVGPARAWDAGGQLRLLQRDAIEEAQGGRMHDLSRGPDPPHLGQVGQIRANLVFPERGRRSPEQHSRAAADRLPSCPEALPWTPSLS